LPPPEVTAGEGSTSTGGRVGAGGGGVSSGTDCSDLLGPDRGVDGARGGAKISTTGAAAAVTVDTRYALEIDGEDDEARQHRLFALAVAEWRAGAKGGDAGAEAEVLDATAPVVTEGKPSVAQQAFDALRMPYFSVLWRTAVG
jgi:hypothetical protein